MLYLLMIYANEASWEALSESEKAATMRVHDEIEADLRKSGQYRGCVGLHPSTAATTVRGRGSAASVTQGPYADSKEQLGGYYMVEAESLDEAITIAKRIPGVHGRAVEIRPVWDLRP